MSHVTDLCLVRKMICEQKIFWWSIYDWPSPGYCCVKKLVLWKWLKSVIVGQWRQLKVTICHTVPIKGCIYFCLDVFSWHFYTQNQLRTEGSKYFSWFKHRNNFDSICRNIFLIIVWDSGLESSAGGCVFSNAEQFYMFNDLETNFNIQFLQFRETCLFSTSCTMALWLINLLRR